MFFLHFPCFWFNIRTYHCCCDGIAKHSVIAIGTHGIIKTKEDRHYFCEGLNIVIRRLKPSAIVVYGKAPHSVFKKYRDAGINILQFDSAFSISHKGVD